MQRLRRRRNAQSGLAKWERFGAQARCVPRPPRPSFVPRDTVVRFRRPARRSPLHAWLAKIARAARGTGPIGIALPLAAFTAVLVWDGGPPGLASTFAAPAARAAGAGATAGVGAAGTDRESTGFAR